MSITTADRNGALASARARTERQYRGTGTYRVTVGGYVVGSVRRASTASVWIACPDDSDTPLTDPKRSFGGGNGSTYSTRKEAVERLARTEGAAQAYRDAARIGAFGVAEETRVRDEDQAALEAIDAELDAQDALIEVLRQAKFAAGTNIIRGETRVTAYAYDDDRLVALRQLAAEHGLEVQDTIAPAVYVLIPAPAPAEAPAVDSGFECSELLEGIKSIDAKPGDQIFAPGQENLVKPYPVVKEGARHINGPEQGPIGVRLDSGSRSTVSYLYVDQHPRISVWRPAN